MTPAQNQRPLASLNKGGRKEECEQCIEVHASQALDLYRLFVFQGWQGVARWIEQKGRYLATPNTEELEKWIRAAEGIRMLRKDALDKLKAEVARAKASLRLEDLQSTVFVQQVAKAEAFEDRRAKDRVAGLLDANKRAEEATLQLLSTARGMQDPPNLRKPDDEALTKVRLYNTDSAQEFNKAVSSRAKLEAGLEDILRFVVIRDAANRAITYRIKVHGDLVHSLLETPLSFELNEDSRKWCKDNGLFLCTWFFFQQFCRVAHPLWLAMTPPEKRLAEAPFLDPESSHELGWLWAAAGDSDRVHGYVRSAWTAPQIWIQWLRSEEGSEAMMAGLRRAVRTYDAISKAPYLDLHSVADPILKAEPEAATEEGRKQLETMVTTPCLWMDQRGAFSTWDDALLHFLRKTQPVWAIWKKIHPDRHVAFWNRYTGHEDLRAQTAQRALDVARAELQKKPAAVTLLQAIPMFRAMCKRALRITDDGLQHTLFQRCLFESPDTPLLRPEDPDFKRWVRVHRMPEALGGTELQPALYTLHPLDEFTSERLFQVWRGRVLHPTAQRWAEKACAHSTGRPEFRDTAIQSLEERVDYLDSTFRERMRGALLTSNHLHMLRESATDFWKDHAKGWHSAMDQTYRTLDSLQKTDLSQALSCLDFTYNALLLWKEFRNTRFAPTIESMAVQCRRNDALVEELKQHIREVAERYKHFMDAWGSVAEPTYRMEVPAVLANDTELTIAAWWDALSQSTTVEGFKLNAYRLVGMEPPISFVTRHVDEWHAHWTQMDVAARWSEFNTPDQRLNTLRRIKVLHDAYEDYVQVWDRLLEDPAVLEFKEKGGSPDWFQKYYFFRPELVDRQAGKWAEPITDFMQLAVRVPQMAKALAKAYKSLYRTVESDPAASAAEIIDAPTWAATKVPFEPQKNKAATKRSGLLLSSDLPEFVKLIDRYPGAHACTA